MAALNMKETGNLSLAERAINDAANRLARASQAVHEKGDMVELDFAEVEFIIKSLRQAKSLVNVVKQVKGYYPA